MSKKTGNRSKRYSTEEKERILGLFRKTNKTRKDFCLDVGVSEATLYNWLKLKKTTKGKKKRRSQYSVDQRTQAVEEFLRSGMKQKDFARAWGVSSKTFSKWVRTYEAQGKRLRPGRIYGTDKKRGRKGISAALKQEILKVSGDLPELGLKALQNQLYRFSGVKPATATIKKTLESENQFKSKQKKKRKRKKSKPRRFERAKPMQLWQSDITSYVLTRSGKRAYLVVFMDDCSRYVVSWGLGLKQSGAFVMEALLDGIQRFGKPVEVLTDQGRQYFSWRGKSEFQKKLEREGIKHVVSRSHHPETLGKCERFWKTVDEEFWKRAHPQEIKEARQRMDHFIAHYNHFRPHQGMNGVTPADRFFGLEKEVREAIEETMVQNELLLALEESPRSPLFFVGQVGSEKITMHGERGRIVVNTPQGGVKEIGYEALGQVKHVKGEIDGGRTGGSDAGETEEESKETGEKFGLQNAKTGGECERIMGFCEPGAEGEGTRSSGVDSGILDGAAEQERSGRETECYTTSGVADEPDGLVGDGRGVAEATENERESEDAGCVDRHKETTEADRGAGEYCGDPGTADCDLPDDARLQGSDLRGGEEKRAVEGDGKWEEIKEDTQESFKPQWENFFWTEEE